MRHVYRLVHIEILFICLFVTALSTDQNSYRRCIGEKLEYDDPNNNNNLLDTLHDETRCEVCSASNSCLRCDKSEPNEDPYHVIMFLSEFQEEFLAVAAGLLDAHFLLTVQFLHESNDTQHQDIYEEILSRVPCKSKEKVKDNLTVFNVKLAPAAVPNENCRITSDEPLDVCTIQAAPRMMLTLEFMMLQEDIINNNNKVHGGTPDLFIMDTSLVAGMLLAERNLVPVVTFGTQKSLDLAIEHDKDWTLNPDWGWFYSVYRILRQRYYSLTLTGAFLELNNLRTQVGLERIGSPHTFLAPVVATFLDFQAREIAVSMGADSSSMVFLAGTLPPPCIPCIPKVSPMKKPKKPMVLVSIPFRADPITIRSLLKGIILARSSLERYDECEWDSLTCRNEATYFDILWLDYGGENMEFFPDILPAYVAREASKGLLDSLVSHPNTIAVVAHCDSQTPLVSRLGVSVLCVSQRKHTTVISKAFLDQTGKLDHQEIARQLISSFRSRTRQKESPKTDKSKPLGLSLALETIELVAQTKRRYGHKWDNVQKMQEIVSLEIKTALIENQTNKKEGSNLGDEVPFDTFTVLSAYLVLIALCLYLLMKDVLTPFFRPRRTQFRTANLFSGLVNRLTDLDDAWAELLAWNERQALQRSESVRRSNPTLVSSHDRSSSRQSSSHNNSNSARRRKRR